MHHTVPGYIDQNVFGLQSTAKKKMVITSWKIVMQAHTNQAYWKICLTPIMCIDMHFHSIFFSTFNTTKHIFIEFVVLLNWTTQQNRSASLRFWLTWQFLKKKKKHGKVCQAQSSLCVVSCCTAILLFVFLSFFFHIIQTKKKKRERSKSNFWRERNDQTNVCCNAVPETQPPLSSIYQAQGVFFQVDAAVLHLHNHSSCMPVASSSKPSRITFPQLLRPQYAMKLSYCQCCFLQSDEQKKSANAWIMNYKKHNTDTKTFFLLP